MELYTCDRAALEADDRLMEDVSGIVAESHLLDRMTAEAERFVYGVDDGDAVSFASLRTKRGGGGTEIYYMAVDPEARGEGYGGAMFDRALDEAADMARERGHDHLYMEVWDDTTDAYDEVKAVVEEEEDYFSDSFMPDYCDAVGVSADDLVDVNTAMKHLAASRGFAEVDAKGSFRQTAYRKPVEQVAAVPQQPVD